MPSELEPSVHRELYEHAACGLAVTDANGLLRCVNRTFCGWLGLQPEQLVERRRFQDLLTVGGRIFHQTHWLPLLQLQGAVAEVQFELLKPDGEVVPVLVNAVARLEGGQQSHHLALFVVSDRRKYERELLLARKRAEELLASERSAREARSLVEAKLREDAQAKAVLAEQLIGIVSHDLRSPVSAVLMGANLLAGSAREGSDARTVQLITAAAQRASRMVTDLLDFTQARLGGGLRVTARLFDARELLSNTVEELKLSWRGRSIELSVTSAGEPQVYADPDRVAQVITNLSNNALTYGAPDLPVVIRARVEAQQLTLSVHNRGKPIPQDLLPFVFEPMRRGEGAAPRGSRNIGLGLYIVRQIALAHDGDVVVESSEAHGTTFVATFSARALR